VPGKRLETAAERRVENTSLHREPYRDGEPPDALRYTGRIARGEARLAPTAPRRPKVPLRHRRFSRAFERENEIALISPTMKKMMIETALASP